MISNDRIRIPYEFDEQEKQTIKDKYHSAKDWNSSSLDGVKSNIRTYLRYLQSNTCCYCKQSLGFDQRQVDIEHIVHKDKHGDFGFEARNLALCCPACNSCKTAQEVLVESKTKQYPVDSNAFKIVHPYFDSYSEHIEILGDSVYVSKSPKGTETIEMCKLKRLTNIECRKRDYLMNRSLVESLIAISDEVHDTQLISETIKKFIL